MDNSTLESEGNNPNDLYKVLRIEAMLREIQGDLGGSSSFKDRVEQIAAEKNELIQDFVAIIEELIKLKHNLSNEFSFKDRLEQIATERSMSVLELFTVAINFYDLAHEKEENNIYMAFVRLPDDKRKQPEIITTFSL